MSGPLVLGIAGSPRRGGNSDRLLEACLEGASGAGATVRTIVVSELRIAPCRGCNACSVTGRCVIRDDMDAVNELMDAAAAIVVASPIFFAGVPAQLKALIDRVQPYWARRYVLGEPAREKRPGGILLVGGSGDPFGADGARATLASFLAIIGVRAAFEHVVEGVDGRDDILARRDDLAKARASGVQLVSLIEA